MSRPSLLIALASGLLLACPARAGTWLPAGKGDCPGPQVIGSPGEIPEAGHCTAAFAGKTALCFTQVCYPGCQYIDVATRDCRGGTELADVYTCVMDPAGIPETGPERP